MYRDALHYQMGLWCTFTYPDAQLSRQRQRPPARVMQGET
jgi:hypothetical protein